MHLETDPAALRQIAAESDARVYASRLAAAVRALEAADLRGLALMLRNSLGGRDMLDSIAACMRAVKQMRNSATHGRADRVAATVARDALGQLWAVAS